MKICGITRIEDAEQAVALGARAIGFVFWPGSARFVEPACARTIVEALPPFVTPVGVFVNQRIADVNAAADRARLGAVQLHGDEDGEYAAAVERPVVKAVSVDDDTASRAVEAWPPRAMLLLDAADPVRRGGTGRTVDWKRAAAIAARRPVLLAGGLTPANVGRAIAAVRPFGIDVSSGVEVSPGIKDHEKLRALFDAVREVTGIHA